jgi:hypothetical protein
VICQAASAVITPPRRRTPIEDLIPTDQRVLVGDSAARPPPIRRLSGAS